MRGVQQRHRRHGQWTVCGGHSVRRHTTAKYIVGPPEGTILLGDGHFTAPWILNPKKKGERDHMLGDEQGREAMIFNERVGYVRAEVEHMFGRSKFGSFARLSAWKFDHACCVQ